MPSTKHIKYSPKYINNFKKNCKILLLLSTQVFPLGKNSVSYLFSIEKFVYLFFLIMREKEKTDSGVISESKLDAKRAKWLGQQIAGTGGAERPLRRLIMSSY